MKLLGIMLHRIVQPRRFNSFRNAAREEGFDDLLIFTPKDVHFATKRINGYMHRAGRWQHTQSRYPVIGYDIGYYSSPATIRLVKSIKYRCGIPFVGYALGDKWTIQKHLNASSDLTPYLLPTQPFISISSLLTSAKEHGTVMIKPINGKGGKGIIKLQQTEDRYMISTSNTIRTLPYTMNKIRPVLQRMLKGGKYIIQKWIDIRCGAGHVYDVRSLMQKEGDGDWHLSGLAVRRSQQARITSNIGNGGNAYEVQPFLQKQFDEEQATRIYATLCELSSTLPPILEQSYQKRFVELGIDLAVDCTGKVWILEVNIKPGKRIISQIYGQKAAKHCFLNPLRYANYLVDNQKHLQLL